MRNKLVAGLTTIVAAGAIVAPAQAQAISPAASTGPTIQAGKCTVRASHDAGPWFTWADCQVSVNNIPAGQSVKVNYKSNLKTIQPKAEFGPFGKQSGTFTFKNTGSQPESLIRDIQIAFPGKQISKVKRNLRVTLSTPTSGVVVTNAVATA
jgi:hypothetical protein